MQQISSEPDKTDRLIHYVISICQGVTLIIIRISIHKSGFCNLQNICTTAALTCHNRKLDFACQMCEKSRPIFEVTPTLQKKWPNQAFFQNTFEKANERHTFQGIRLFYYSKCFLSILIAPRSLIKFHSGKVNWCEMDLRSQINAGISLDLC